MIQDHQLEHLLETLARRYPTVSAQLLEKTLRDAVRLAHPRDRRKSYVLMVAAMLLEDLPGVVIIARPRRFHPFAFWLGLALASYLVLAWFHKPGL